MASKSKAGGVSAGSFFELKSELAKQADEFSRLKATGGTKYVTGETKKTKVCTLTYPLRKLKYVYRNQQYGRDLTKASNPGRDGILNWRKSAR